MIKASEARFKSRYQKVINDILANIEKDINEAILNGKFACKSTIRVDTDQAVRDEIEKQMFLLGYNITVPKKTTYVGPSDQAPWYDDVTVCWGVEGENT